MEKHKIRSKEIGVFLKSLNEAERLYLGHCLNLSNSIKNQISKYKLSKQYICEKFKIKPNKYNDLVSGNMNYDLHHMCAVNLKNKKKEAELLEEQVPVQFPSDKKTKSKTS